MNIRTTEKGSILKLFDLSGQELLQTTITDLITEINCNRLIQGVYVWKLYKNSREIDRGKWIKL